MAVTFSELKVATTSNHAAKAFASITAESMKLDLRSIEAVFKAMMPNKDMLEALTKSQQIFKNIEINSQPISRFIEGSLGPSGLFVQQAATLGKLIDFPKHNFLPDLSKNALPQFGIQGNALSDLVKIQTSFQDNEFLKATQSSIGLLNNFQLQKWTGYLGQLDISSWFRLPDPEVILAGLLEQLPPEYIQVRIFITKALDVLLGIDEPGRWFFVGQFCAHAFEATLLNAYDANSVSKILTGKRLVRLGLFDDVKDLWKEANKYRHARKSKQFPIVDERRVRFFLQEVSLMIRMVLNL